MNLIPEKSDHDVRVHILPDYVSIGLIGLMILFLMVVNKKLLS